eukprot:g9809.t1
MQHLREQLTDVYLVSVAGSAFDLVSWIYRYGYFYIKGRNLEEAKAGEIQNLEISLRAHEEEWNNGNNNSSAFVSMAKSLTPALESTYKIIRAPMAMLFESEFNERLNEIIERARERVADERSLEIIKKVADSYHYLYENMEEMPVVESERDADERSLEIIKEVDDSNHDLYEKMEDMPVVESAIELMVERDVHHKK